MVKVTMSQVLNLRQNIGFFLSQKLPLPVAYKLNKINNAASKEADFYQEKFNEIVEKYAKKDENGNLVFSEDGEQIIIKEDLVGECNDALEELMDLEVEIDNLGLTIDAFGDNIECTATEIDAIVPFLD